MATGTGEESDPRFGLSGGAEIWMNYSGENTYYVVYTVPGTEADPVYMRWTVPSFKDVQSFFGPGQTVTFDRKVSDSDAEWKDAVDFGSSDDIGNRSKAPFDSWASTLEIESASKPWIMDKDYQELLAMSLIEGRPLTNAEIQTTRWWNDNPGSKRAWMELSNGDPTEAARRLDDNRITQANYLRANGMNEVNEDLANWMADKVTMGEWSAPDMQRQTKLMTDSYFEGEPLREDLQDYIDDNRLKFSMTQDQETEVRNTVKRWLGTNFGAWTDEQVGDWAGRLRNENDASEVLAETLKDQKQVLFSGYDREADYQTIAAPWRNMMQNMWGEAPDDSDLTLQTVIQMNNAGDAGKLLTKEGLARGNDVVVNTVQGALDRSFGGL